MEHRLPMYFYPILNMEKPSKAKCIQCSMYLKIHATHFSLLVAIVANVANVECRLYKYIIRRIREKDIRYNEQCYSLIALFKLYGNLTLHMI
jgi:hypothetical protein